MVLGGERVVLGGSVQSLLGGRIEMEGLRYPLLCFLLLATVSCKRAEAPAPLPEISSESDEGFVDLVFAIESRAPLPNGAERIRVARDRDREVALAISLQPAWKAAELEGLKLLAYRGDLLVDSVGQRSDALVQAIDRLYATNFGSISMRHEVRFTGISLGGNPMALDAGLPKIKLFYEEGNADDYAELCLNVDVKQGTVQRKEQ